MKKIVIASGKGGTGKTTVALNLAYYLSTHPQHHPQHKVRLLDCDVEVPNANLFLRAHMTRTIPVTVSKPVWEPEQCGSSGNCVSVCHYNAIARVKDQVLIFNELCHSCGACVYFCPGNALKPGEIGIGKIELAEDHVPFFFGQGTLNLGESLAPQVIQQLKEHMDDDAINLLDAPPGTGCPVVKTMEGMDYCLLVTEPTPFGLNDLALAAALASKQGIPTGIVINRSYGQDRIIEDFSEKYHIPIVGKIPFRREYAESYSRGEVLLEHHPELVEVFSRIHREMNKEQRLPTIEIEREEDIGDDDVFETPAEAKDIPHQPCREIAVISGKGGTGKTTVTSALTFLMENKVLADTDVDASNLHLLCDPERFHARDFVGGEVFVIDQDACIACGECAEQCRFGAITMEHRDGDVRVEIDEIACEGCGFCYHLCPTEAISSKEAISGKWYLSRTPGSFLSHARLGIGEENSGKLVSMVRKNAAWLAGRHGAENILSDGPPGAGCPVISAITGVDLALVVTEPTLSGIHDMQRTLDLAKHFNVPALIIVNKCDLNWRMTEKIESMADEYHSRVIGKIPFDKKVHDALIDRKSIAAVGEGEAYGALLAMWNNLRQEIKTENGRDI